MANNYLPRRQLHTSLATSRLKTGLQPLKEVPDLSLGRARVLPLKTQRCPMLKPRLSDNWSGMQNNVQRNKRSEL